MAGSSPLTRGKREDREVYDTRAGLIPAHAGKTACAPVSISRPWAHPRSRGENADFTVPDLRGRGSSPLTRGKPVTLLDWSDRVGLIPAHAGKTPLLSAGSTGAWAHPRSRGENLMGLATTDLTEGSSPLTRGKPSDCREDCADDGLIPAHAGKTSRSCRRRSRLRAHPRSRGENNAGRRGEGMGEGSSPLTRGKPTPRQSALIEVGLIPAHAGKTQARCTQIDTLGAHPRSRGENPATCGSCVAVAGSSPLTRGKQAHGHPHVLDQRLIPAHAGKTSTSGYRRKTPQAHPRSRGENLIGGCLIAPGQGSSPLTRGKRRSPRRWDGARRLIPAHAGKTLHDLRFYRADRSDLGKP